MYFERKELIQSLDLLCFILFVYTWLLDNRTFLLLVKAALQVQFCNPIQMHPTWPLPFFVVFLLCLNSLLALAHLWAPAAQTNTGDAILLDFIGQTYLPGRIHMLAIDAAVCVAQLLMTVVAFEMGKDDVKPDGEPSELDDATNLLQDEDQGQGWDVRDEEAALFGLDEEESKRRKTSLTHHIAVIRLRPIFDQIAARQFLPTQPNDSVEAEAGAGAAQTPPADPSDVDRPDTSRLRRFSRRPRSGPPADREPGATQGLGPVSADDSWPPMWVIVARNMIGGESRFSSLNPLTGLAALRNNVTSRFGRSFTHAAPPPPPPPDRSQYTRINSHPDSPPDA